MNEFRIFLDRLVSNGIVEIDDNRASDFFELYESGNVGFNDAKNIAAERYYGELARRVADVLCGEEKEEPLFIYAPWDDKTVANLNYNQESGIIHPYTCDNGHTLKATHGGFICEQCRYTQGWAHSVTGMKMYGETT